MTSFAGNKRRFNLAYLGVLVILIAVGLLATTTVADAVLKYAALDLSFLTGAYSGAGLALGYFFPRTPGV